MKFENLFVEKIYKIKNKETDKLICLNNPNKFPIKWEIVKREDFLESNY